MDSKVFMLGTASAACVAVLVTVTALGYMVRAARAEREAEPQCKAMSRLLRDWALQNKAAIEQQGMVARFECGYGAQQEPAPAEQNSNWRQS